MDLPPLDRCERRECGGSVLGRAVRELSGRTEAGRPPLRRLHDACRPGTRFRPRASKRDARSITIEAPAGAAVSLLPASARDLLPVPVTSPRRAAGNRRDATAASKSPGPRRLRVGSPLPLRPPRAMAVELLEACRAADDRPNPWCLIAFASRETARLMERLTESWGQGVACLTRRNQDEGDHGIPHGEASLIQQCSADARLVGWRRVPRSVPGPRIPPSRLLALAVRVPSELRRAGRLPSSGPCPLHVGHPRRRARPPAVETGTGRENRRRAIDPPVRKPGARPGCRSFLPSSVNSYEY